MTEGQKYLASLEGKKKYRKRRGLGKAGQHLSMEAVYKLTNLLASSKRKFCHPLTEWWIEMSIKEALVKRQVGQIKKEVARRQAA